MRRDPVKLLGPLLRAVKDDKPIPDAWQQPLVDLVMLLLDHPNSDIRLRAVYVVVAMTAADQRLEFIDRRLGRVDSPTARSQSARSADDPRIIDSIRKLSGDDLLD
jgi:hypothetical protein